MAKTFDEVMELVSKTAEIATSNTASTEVILTELQKQRSLLTGLSSTVNGMEQSITGLAGEVERLKLNEEITTTQQENIINNAKKRVIDILGNDELEHKKYFRTFIQRLYTDCRKYAGLGSKIARTKKGDYQRCIDYIEAWNPSCGCIALREKADKNAKARLKARELGYAA